jgi:hypothetical protein
MMRHVLAAGLLLAGGGAAIAHGRPPAPAVHRAEDYGRPQAKPAAVVIAHPVSGIVTRLATGVIALETNPAQLPAGVAAETTGTPQVDAMLPMAANVQISGSLAVGAHVAVALSGDTVVAVVVEPSPPVAPSPATPAPAAQPPRPQSGSHRDPRGS